MTSPGVGTKSAPNSPVTPTTVPSENGNTHHRTQNQSEPPAEPEELQMQDYTIEILMSRLSPEARAPFISEAELDSESGSELSSRKGLALSSAIGISNLFPSHLTTLDAYSFTPCGYSSNALIKRSGTSLAQPGGQSGGDGGGDGYYTIHVTPEAGWSYASFECNVPLRNHASCQPEDIPDLKTLIRRVVKIFQPERLTLTLFISSEHNNADDEESETAIEAAHRAFKAALTRPWLASPNSFSMPSLGERFYKRTDKINYEFGGYDLAFASFELH